MRNFGEEFPWWAGRGPNPRRLTSGEIHGDRKAREPLPRTHALTHSRTHASILVRGIRERARTHFVDVSARGVDGLVTKLGIALRKLGHVPSRQAEQVGR